MNTLIHRKLTWVLFDCNGGLGTVDGYSYKLTSLLTYLNIRLCPILFSTVLFSIWEHLNLLPSFLTLWIFFSEPISVRFHYSIPTLFFRVYWTYIWTQYYFFCSNVQRISKFQKISFLLKCSKTSRPGEFFTIQYFLKLSIPVCWKLMIAGIVNC